MSSALAMASVTAVLKNLLDNALIHQTASLGDVIVTALPPDRVATGTEERNQLNLFLYRITPNTGLRTNGAAASPPQHQHRPTLVLDLHYLLTAYGERDFQTEILLGQAIQLLHETPVLTQDVIRLALSSTSSGDANGAAFPALAALSTSTLAEQAQQIKISPEFLSMEEMSKLWSSLQARCRLSATYKASTVIIENRRVNVTEPNSAAKAVIS